jgi:hypothetical protein
VTVTHEEQTSTARRRGVGIVDVDVHNGVRSIDDLKPFLPERWHVYLPQISGRTWAGVTVGARQAPDLFRRDSHPPSGAPPGSDLDFLREQLLDRWGITRGILNPLEMLAWQLAQFGELGHALATASNKWLAAEWLDPEPRLYASICVPVEDGPRAALEIEQVSRDPRFVAVMMTSGAREPYGHPKYFPIWEAAAERDLPIIIHVGGWSGTLVATGWPTYWCEQHTQNFEMFATHAVSLVYSGVFDRLPNLKIVLEEGAIGWMPSLMWRLDRMWKDLRHHVPHMERKPSEVIRDRFWFTTQPLDEPNKSRYLIEMFDHLDMDDRVLFATDYPHHDFDAPDRVFPPELGQERRDRFFALNAEALFNFPDKP